MRKIACSVETARAGEVYRAVIEVDDDATEEEIDEIVREWAFNYVSWGWDDAPGDAEVRGVKYNIAK